MIEEYVRDIENIHASEALILKTVQRAKQEEKRQKHSGAKIIRLGGAAIAAAAAAIIIVNFGIMDRSTYIINEIDGIETEGVRSSGLFKLKDDTENEMSEEEFEEYIGLDGEKLFESADFEKSIIVGETGTYLYGSDDIDISVKISKTDDVIPDNVWDLKKSEIEGKKVRLARNENKYYAAGEGSDIEYFITVRCEDEKQFKKLIKEFLQKLK